MDGSNLQPIIGLEVHLELATLSKMFCGCLADHFGVEPNTHTCPVCLGLPGALPVPNKKAIDWTILLGMALGCRINSESKFDRKNYFYPDLPKGYQISQYDEPLCQEGVFSIKYGVSSRKIKIRRVHLEEDTGKLIHTKIAGEKVALVDYNRSGVPLVEIVTEPDFRSVEEVDIFLKNLQRIIRYLEISGADMEKGSMRLEPSISISTDGELPAYRVELKNINSFRFVRKALEYEVKRQTELLQTDQVPIQQTRGWNESKNATVAQRAKEQAHDYRYFPEPDIPPVKIDKDWVDRLRKQIPELPESKKQRFSKIYNLKEPNVSILTESKDVANYFEESVKASLKMPNFKKLATIEEIAHWIVNKRVDVNQTLPAELLGLIIQAKRTGSLDQAALEEVIDAVLAKNAKAREDYKTGKHQVIQYLIGQVLKEVKVKASLVKEKLESKLKYE